MNMMIPIAAALAAAAAQAGATESPRPGEEARIPFPGLGGVRNFRSVGEDEIWFQDRSRNWYRATLAGMCRNLPTALSIGFDTRYSSTLDDTAVLLVDGERCPIHTLVRADGPPPRRPRR